MSSLTLRRSASDRMFFGVCGGIAQALRVDVVPVRIIAAASVLLGGAGLAIYFIVGLFFGPPLREEPRAQLGQRLGEAIGVAVLLSALLFYLHLRGLLLPIGFSVPITLLIGGVALIWRRAHIDRRPGGRKTRANASEAGRIIGGCLLICVGAYAFLGPDTRIPTFLPVVTAIAAIAGVGLLLAPRISRARRQIETERLERIRIEERERVAAQLHDSVLQTFALIQRTDDPKRSQQLSRRQDRELRAWLYGGEDPTAPETLAAALRRVADDVEEQYGIAVDLVQPSDLPLDDDLRALVAAVREAMTNAAKHAGVGEVSVYARVTDREASAFIRDRGCGFDRGSVSADRKGLRESIEGRMRTHGGTATIQSMPGMGTEIELILPRKVLA